MYLKISGTVKFFNFEGGFWGIESGDEQYLPLNMPEQLKTHEATISCTVKIEEEVATAISWGKPCSIFSFTTISN